MLTLHANGVEVARLGSSQTHEEYATFLFPMESLLAHSAADDIPGVHILGVEYK